MHACTLTSIEYNRVAMVHIHFANFLTILIHNREIAKLHLPGPHLIGKKSEKLEEVRSLYKYVHVLFKLDFREDFCEDFFPELGMIP